jgi:hypothetical protein
MGLRSFDVAMNLLCRELYARAVVAEGYPVQK